MPRTVDPNIQSACESGLLRPAYLVMVTFANTTEYVWSGIGPLTWNAQTFTGVGSLGSVDTAKESMDLRADGASLTLSGIDPTLYGECMNEIQVGLPAKVWFGALNQDGVLLGTPVLMFSGQVDAPHVDTGVDQITVSIPLEPRMIDLNRACNVRWTAEDQQQKYPTDISLKFVPLLQDIALKWAPR